MIDPSTPREKWMAIYSDEADRARVTIAMMLGSCRRAEIVRARHAAWDRMQRDLGMGVTEIGRCANRHWTTVLHGVRLMEYQRERLARMSEILSPDIHVSPRPSVVASMSV